MFSNEFCKLGQCCLLLILFKGLKEVLLFLFFNWALLLLLQVEVAKLEDEIYHLCIVCHNGHGVLVQLMQALESLGIDFVNTDHISFQDYILNTFVAQVCM
jgi:hypothetical protein